MNGKVILVIKGYIMGLANLIPGVSGGTLALSMGIYEDFIGVFGHLFFDFKKNLSFVVPVLTGIILAFLTLSKVILLCLIDYTFPTVMFFAGAIAGGLPMIVGKLKELEEFKASAGNILVFSIAFALVLISAFSKSGGAAVSPESVTPIVFLILAALGVAAAAAMVVPGVSGSALLMTLGYYNYIIGALSNLTVEGKTVPSLAIIVPYAIGLLIGLFSASRIIEKLLQNYEVKSYWAILGFVLSSIPVVLIVNLMPGFPGSAFVLPALSFAQLAIGAGLGVFGFLLACKLG